MGFEPTTFALTGRRALQAAPRGQATEHGCPTVTERKAVVTNREISSSSGIRTHSIFRSKREWSANCLPSRAKRVLKVGVEPTNAWV
jgi:hypothetical protein